MGVVVGSVRPNLALRGPRLAAFLGDSITAQGFGGSESLGHTFATPGYATWAAFLSRRRIEILPASNHGVSGETSAQILARVDNVIAMRPGVCVVLAGTNDIGTLTPAESIANLGAIYDRLSSADIAVVAVMVTPRGGITTAQYGKIHQINRYILRQRETRRNFYVVDATLAYGDPATGAPRVTMSSDQLHPNAYGAWAIGNEISPLLTELYPDAYPPFANPLDLYSADNPSGNLLASGVGLMVGTTGTLSNGPTGELAAGWSANGINMPAGSTTVFSKLAKADGRSFQQVAFGGSYNVASPSNLNVTTAVSVHTLCAAGNVLEAACELEADAGIANLAAAQLLLNIATPAGNPIPTDFTGNNTYLLPPVAFAGVLKTPRVTLPAAPTTVTAILRFTPAGVTVSSSLAATLRFGSVCIRKVT